MTNTTTNATSTTISSAPERQETGARASSGAAKAAARRFRKIGGKWLARIARHADDHEKAKGLTREFYQSLSGRFMAMEAVNKKRRLRDRWTIDELIEGAKQLNPWQDPDEPVHVTARKKPTDGKHRRGQPVRHRLTCAYRWRRKGLQALVDLPLRSYAEGKGIFRPHQFSVPEHGGRPAASRHFTAAIANPRNKFVGKLDVVDCFPSITEDGIASTLPIPRRVVQNVLMTNTRNLIYPLYDDDGDRVDIPRRGLTGLSQGSLVSCTVASIILAPLADSVPPEIERAMYADDLAVAGQTRAETEAAVFALHAAARRLPSGPLCLKDSGVRHVRHGIDYLGQHLARKKGQVSVEPTARAKNRFTAKAREVMSRPPSPERDQSYRSLSRGFEAQHRLWPEVEEWTWLRRVLVEAQGRWRFADLRKAARYLYRNL